MSLTKFQVTSLVSNQIDDPNNTFWTVDLLNQLISMVYDERWVEILTLSPYYLSTLETITGAPKLTATGYIDITQLTNRFYKIQSLVRDGRTYDEIDPRQIQLEANKLIVGPDFHYTFYDAQIWPFPISASQQLELRYSYLPARFYTINDNVVITWPEGFEAALIYEAASRALTRGDREENARIQQIADRSWMSLLSYIRRTRKPIVPYDYKQPEDWGGV